MSDLPPGWEWATLDELCEINPRSYDIDPADDDLISFVPMAAVQAESGIIDASQHLKYGSTRGKSLTQFQEDDVLFAKITPCMENGKIAIARGLHGGRGVGSTEFHVLRSLGAVTPDYLAHFLLQSRVREDTERNMTGAVGQRRVPRGYLATLRIPIPAIGEQQRIVATLEDHLSHVDLGISATQQAKCRLENLVTSARHAITTNLSCGTQTLGDILVRIEAGKSFAVEGRPAKDDEWGSSRSVR